MLSAGRMTEDLFSIFIFCTTCLSIAQWKHLEDNYKTTEEQC